MNKLKVEKIKVYTIEETVIAGTKPPITSKVKKYLHSELSQGFWANVRDLSLNESLQATQAGVEITLQFTINWQDKIIDLWNKSVDMFIEFKANTYKFEAKPDQFDYLINDMVIRATRIIDPEIIEVIEYE